MPKPLQPIHCIAHRTASPAHHLDQSYLGQSQDQPTPPKPSYTSPNSHSPLPTASPVVDHTTELMATTHVPSVAELLRKLKIQIAVNGLIFGLVIETAIPLIPPEQNRIIITATVFGILFVVVSDGFLRWLLRPNVLGPHTAYAPLGGLVVFSLAFALSMTGLLPRFFNSTRVVALVELCYWFGFALECKTMWWLRYSPTWLSPG